MDDVQKHINCSNNGPRDDLRPSLCNGDGCGSLCITAELYGDVWSLVSVFNCQLAFAMKWEGGGGFTPGPDLW
jgi:hypothetical protein